MAACTYPYLIDTDLFPVDVQERARRILNGLDGGSIGKYCRVSLLNVDLEL